MVRARSARRRKQRAVPPAATQTHLDVLDAQLTVRVDVNILEAPRAGPLLARKLALRSIQPELETNAAHVRCNAPHATRKASGISDNNARRRAVYLPAVWGGRGRDRD